MFVKISRLLRTVWRRNEVPTVSEDELIELSAAAAEADAIDESERDMIESALTLGDTVVREVMVPRIDMVTVSIDRTVTDALEVAINHGLSRLPVCDPDIDHIAGVVLLKDLASVERFGKHKLLAAEEHRTSEEHKARPELLFGRKDRSYESDNSLRVAVREVMFVPETKRLDELLSEMRTTGGHLSVVVDEYGGTAGLVTLEDLVEELVGEIVDEFDPPEPMLFTHAGKDALLEGRMPLDQLNTLTNADLPDDDWDTVAGLIFGQLGRVPEKGETIEVNNCKLTVERIQDRRITLVRLRQTHK